MAGRRATIYLRENLVEALGRTQEQGLTQRIAAMLLRFQSVAKAIMPEFSRAEWCAIMDANNGGTDMFLAEIGDYPSGSGIWANVHDSPELGEKWEIDQDSLVKRLQKLSPAELIAVDEAIARFWNHTDLDTDEALKVAWCNIAEES